MDSRADQHHGDARQPHILPKQKKDLLRGSTCVMGHSIRIDLRCTNILIIDSTVERVACQAVCRLGSTDHISKNGYGYRASHRHFESVNALVEAGIASGELKDLPPLLLGEFFYNIASVPYIYMQNNPECFENKAYWDDIYEIIRCALARRP